MKTDKSETDVIKVYENFCQKKMSIRKKCKFIIKENDYKKKVKIKGYQKKRA